MLDRIRRWSTCQTVINPKEKNRSMASFIQTRMLALFIPCSCCSPTAAPQPNTVCSLERSEKRTPSPSRLHVYRARNKREKRRKRKRRKKRREKKKPRMKITNSWSTTPILGLLPDHLQYCGSPGWSQPEAWQAPRALSWIDLTGPGEFCLYRRWARLRPFPAGVDAWVPFAHCSAIGQCQTMTMMTWVARLQWAPRPTCPPPPPPRPPK